MKPRWSAPLLASTGVSVTPRPDTDPTGVAVVPQLSPPTNRTTLLRQPAQTISQNGYQPHQPYAGLSPQQQLHGLIVEHDQLDVTDPRRGELQGRVARLVNDPNEFAAGFQLGWLQLPPWERPDLTKWTGPIYAPGTIPPPSPGGNPAASPGGPATGLYPEELRPDPVLPGSPTLEPDWTDGDNTWTGSDGGSSAGLLQQAALGHSPAAPAASDWGSDPHGGTDYSAAIYAPAELPSDGPAIDSTALLLAGAGLAVALLVVVLS